jgi:hypothetical protein
MFRGVLALLLSLAGSALAGDMAAARTANAPKIDGQVGEEEWAGAPVYTDFVEQFPSEGAVPDQRTEVRVLYDNATLYVSIICFDSEPEKIIRALGRRDSTPTADLLEVAIDSSFDRRSAYYFSINASGVLRDALIFGDVNLVDTWDGVWTGSVAARPDGWSAELAIPLAILRFPAAAEQKWGFAVRRTIPRTHQVFDSTLLPRSANALVSRFAQLTGVVDLKPRRDIEVTPYVAARAALRPQYSDAALPQPRLLDPSADIGIDLRAALFSDLMLNATLNPDFGQVEADQIILNLGTQEVFFPEKRPFFNEGLDLFQPVGAEYGAPQQLFYSRRIGLDTPVLAAAKLTGTVAEGFRLGVLDAVVVGASDPSKRSIAFLDGPSSDQITAAEMSPNRAVAYSPTRPFHLGLGDALPADRPTPKNYLAVIARKDFNEQFALGATATTVDALAPRCTPADFQTEAAYQAASCLGQGGQTFGLDWNLRSENHDWVFLGMFDGSRREGGPLDDVQRDGTDIRPNDWGYGGYMRAGKFGGEGFRFDALYALQSPKLDINALGFLPSQNQQRVGVNLRYVRTKDLSWARDFYAAVYAFTFWTTDGRWIPRGNYVSTEANMTFHNFWNLGIGINFDNNRYDVREITQSGIPFQKRDDVVFIVYGNSDPNRLVSARADAVVYRTDQLGPVPAGTGFQADLSVIARPHPRFETQLGFHIGGDPNGARYVDTLPDLDAADPSRQHFLFGLQDSQNFSATLRQTIVFTPTLTLQAYAQLFSAFAHYPMYFEGDAAHNGLLNEAALHATSTGSNYDFHSAALNVNVVLRWEYRLGSTLFVVYSRSQNELGYQADQAPTTALWPLRLGPGPTTDTFMVKWSYWFSA